MFLGLTVMGSFPLISPLSTGLSLSKISLSQSLTLPVSPRKGEQVEERRGFGKSRRKKGKREEKKRGNRIS
jgi:hypothetical protein